MKRGNKIFSIRLFNEKKAQLTIFVIIALVIIGMGLLIYTFYPDLTGTGYSKSENPEEFLKGCIQEKDIQKKINKITIQGGSMNPENTIDYYGNDVEYLCYASDYYEQCVIQKPMLKNHVEKEIYNAIQGDIKTCINELEDSFSERGYSIDMGSELIELNIIPEKIQIKLNNNIKLEKAEETKNYDSLEISLNSNLYEILMIATNILKWETNYGDAETTTYMTYYRDIKVEKNKLSDGTTIYKITNRDSGEKFQFASRSVAWPPGYGV